MDQALQKSSSNLWAVLLLAAAAGCVAVTASIYSGVATFSFGLLCLGLGRRRWRKQHVLLMNLGILFDLALVLILEIQRGAVETAVSFTLTPLQQAHIGASSVATALYIPVLILGWTRYHGAGSAVDQNGNTDILNLDVYQPAGDTVTYRPAIIWVHGGSFSGGDKTSGELRSEEHTSELQSH